jgi:hypothetical protein
MPVIRAFSRQARLLRLIGFSNTNQGRSLRDARCFGTNAVAEASEYGDLFAPSV